MRSLLFIFVIVLRLGLLPTCEVITRLRSSVYFLNSIERRTFTLYTA